MEKSPLHHFPAEKYNMDAMLMREVRRLRQSLTRRGIHSVLLGLSGGPDSVLAFHLLRLASEGIPGFKLAIAHANFHLRGKESLRDEGFVRNLVSRYPEVDSHFKSFDTERYCRDYGISIEMGARQLRHEWFDSLRESHGYERIATGHNADDNEETLLLNLLRGSGSRGLRGMMGDNGRILRVILHLGRKEVINLLSILTDSESTDPPYITDSSNLTDDYRRNFLRHKIIPLLEERWPGTHTSLRNTLRIMQEENRIVEHVVADALQDSEALLTWERIKNFPSPLTLILNWIHPHGGTPSIAEEMTSALVSAISQSPRTGARWLLPDGMEVTSTTKGLRKRAINRDMNSCPEMNVESIAVMPDTRESLMREIRSAKPDCVYIPSPPDSYEWRTAKTGDRMRVGERICKKVSRILKESDVTAASRGKIRMLCRRSDDKPIWIPGIRRGFDDRVTGNENIIYKITIQ